MNSFCAGLVALPVDRYVLAVRSASTTSTACDSAFRNGWWGSDEVSCPR